MSRRVCKRRDDSSAEDGENDKKRANLITSHSGSTGLSLATASERRTVISFHTSTRRQIHRLSSSTPTVHIVKQGYAPLISNSARPADSITTALREARTTTLIPSSISTCPSLFTVKTAPTLFAGCVSRREQCLSHGLARPAPKCTNASPIPRAGSFPNSPAALPLQTFGRMPTRTLCLPRRGRGMALPLSCTGSPTSSRSVDGRLQPRS